MARSTRASFRGWDRQEEEAAVKTVHQPGCRLSRCLQLSVRARNASLAREASTAITSSSLPAHPHGPISDIHIVLLAILSLLAVVDLAVARQVLLQAARASCAPTTSLPPSHTSPKVIGPRRCRESRRSRRCCCTTVSMLSSSPLLHVALLLTLPETLLLPVRERGVELPPVWENPYGIHARSEIHVFMEIHGPKSMFFSITFPCFSISPPRHKIHQKWTKATSFVLLWSQMAMTEPEQCRLRVSSPKSGLRTGGPLALEGNSLTSGDRHFV